jgi:hypothetical protein
MWARKLRNAMPVEPCEIHVFHALAIEMDIEVFEQLRNPFSHLPLGTVALVDEWRDDCE